MIKKFIAITAIVFTVAGLACPLHADIVFMLDAGSKITLTGGVAEPLEGTFVWRNAGPGSTGTVGVIAEIYDTVLLDLRSPSFTITLNTTLNDRASVALSDNTTAFGEIVNGNGFSSTVLDMITVFPIGTFEGTYLSPSRLINQDIWLFPKGGNFSLARLEFSATAVPEPSSVALIATSFAGLLVFRRRSIGNLRLSFFVIPRRTIRKIKPGDSHNWMFM